MKPKSESTRHRSRSENDAALSPSRPASPIINYSYHAAPAALSATKARTHQGPKRKLLAPGFRKISNEFLGAEMTRDYVAEFLFFAIITAVSAWPIVSLVQALERWMK